MIPPAENCLIVQMHDRKQLVTAAFEHRYLMVHADSQFYLTKWTK